MAESSPHPSVANYSRGRIIQQRVPKIVIISTMTVFMTLIALEAGFRLMPQTIPLGACKSSLTLAHSYCEYNYQYDDPLRLGYIFNDLQSGLEGALHGTTWWPWQWGPNKRTLQEWREDLHTELSILLEACTEQ